jgi:hypothetical protein
LISIERRQSTSRAESRKSGYAIALEVAAMSITVWPKASLTDTIVFAENIPAHVPIPGQAGLSMAFNSLALMRRFSHEPIAAIRQTAGRERLALGNRRRRVHPHHREQHTRNGFVTVRNRNKCIIALCSHDELN